MSRDAAAAIVDEAMNVARSVDAQRHPAAAMRLPWLVRATALKLGLTDDVSGLADVEVTFRFSLLLHIAEGQLSARAAVEPIARATVAQLADRAHEKVTGLALWAGMSREASGYDALPDTYRAIAVERVLRAGVPANLEAALGWIDEMLPQGPGRDAALLALFQSRCPVDGTADAGDWLGVLERIAWSVLRAQGLLELATQASAGTVSAAMVTAARQAYDEAVGESGLWGGYPRAAFGGVVAGSDAEEASALLAAAWQSLEALTEPGPRTQAYQVLLLAETQRGIDAWQATLERLGRDLPLKADPRRWADLVFDAAGLARFVRGGAGYADAALAAVRRLTGRITLPEVRALVLAAIAEACGWTARELVGAALEDVEGALKATQDPRVRATILPRIARLCGRADHAQAVSMVRLCRSAHEQIMWLLPLAEQATPPTA